MKITAHFSWTAPRDLFFQFPPSSGTPREICQLIKKDAEQTLRDKPGLEAFEDYYNLSGATRFILGGKKLPRHDHDEDEPGDDLYQLEVKISGTLDTTKSWEEIASYNRCEVWDEIYDYGDIFGDPARFRVSVKRVG